jgi:hypothetical protein
MFLLLKMPEYFLLIQEPVLLIEALMIIFFYCYIDSFSPVSPPAVKFQFSDQLDAVRVILGSDMTSSAHPISFLSVDVT